MRHVIVGIALAAGLGCGRLGFDEGLSIDRGLIGYWPFDGDGTVATDRSGSGYDGTLAGDARISEGRVGDALSLDGAGAHVAIDDPLDSQLVVEMGSFSYSVWVLVASSVGASDMPFWKGGSSTSNQGYDFELGTGMWRAFLSDGTSPTMQVEIGPETLGEWVLLTAVVDREANVVTTYRDAVAVQSLPITIGSVGTVRPTYLGCMEHNTGVLDYFFHGKIDELRIYDRALAADEVEQLFAQ